MTSIGGGPYTGGSIKRPPLPPPPYITQPRMHPPTGWAQPCMVMQPETGHEKNLEIWSQGGNPWKSFGCRVRRGLIPPCTPTGTGGVGREATGVPAEVEMGQGFFSDLENRWEPLAIFGLRIWRGPTPPRTPTGTGRQLGSQRRLQRVNIK